jgi:2,3-bisphosphoglycerate-independent phosphoglycerate mutase
MHENGTPRRPVVLIILDGFGGNPSKKNNAIIAANTPNFDKLFAQNPHTLIHASGLAVGLPNGQMGNSEVGHITLGSGSIIKQDLVLLDQAICDLSFFNNDVLVDSIKHAKALNRPIHLLGLVSDGGIHSHIRHLQALIQICIRFDVKPLLHMITDGRDTAPRSALTFLNSIEPVLEKARGQVASVSGRFYSMDRDNRWDRTEKAWRAYALAEGQHTNSARQAIEQSYEQGIDDEFILPTLIGDYQPMQTDDSMIFFNFRKDRPRQMLASFFKEDFEGFDRGEHFKPLHITCLMEYDQWYKLPFAFEHDRPKTTLSNILSMAGIKQFHCAETEKYAHVTYFFNGGRGDILSGEVHKVIPSPQVETYDLQPEMSAKEVADEVITALDTQEYGFIVVNFANGDMVGHTAVRDAVIKAVETLDTEASRVIECAKKNEYSVILTADHGNCDELIDPSSQVAHTQHTTYPVPCLVIDPTVWKLSTEGGLGNISPTILHLMGIEIPNEMDQNSLLLS